MNSNEIKAKIQNEINNIVETNRNKYRRQNAITKWAREQLQSLGLWEYIEACPREVGQTDATNIIASATGETFGSADRYYADTRSISRLLKALGSANTDAGHTVTVTVDSNFEIDGVNFRVYGTSLWSDGGEYDDLVIRNLPELNDITDYREFEITVSDAELAEARDHQEYLTEDAS